MQWCKNIVAAKVKVYLKQFECQNFELYDFENFFVVGNLWALASFVFSLIFQVGLFVTAHTRCRLMCVSDKFLFSVQHRASYRD